MKMDMLARRVGEAGSDCLVSVRQWHVSKQRIPASCELMPLTYAAVGTIQPLAVVRKKAPSVSVGQVVHEATTEGEEGYVEEVRQFTQLCSMPSVER